MLSLSFSPSAPLVDPESPQEGDSTAEQQVAGRIDAGAQTEPTGLILNQIHTGSSWVTSITREWASAKAARGRCRLCPRADCVVSPRGVCNVMVVGKVDEDDAWLYARPGAPVLDLALDSVPGPVPVTVPVTASNTSPAAPLRIVAPAQP